MPDGQKLRRVVIVGADFVPSSLPPSIRIRLFARHLPAFGWSPAVLSVHPRYYENSVDWENEKLLTAETRVIRTNAVSQRLTRRVGAGDLGLRSMWHHWQALRWLCEAGEVDLLYIPIPPYVPAILGRLAWERYRVPYVIDYIDPWVDDYYARLPVHARPGGRKWALSQRMARTLEPFAIGRAAHLTAVAAGYVSGVLDRNPRVTSDAVTAIPYGGEPEDFAYVRDNPRANPIFDPLDGYIHLSYVGRAGADMHPVISVLFRAIQEGLCQSPGIFGRLRMHFVGTTYAPEGQQVPQVAGLSAKMGVAAVVDEHPGRISYLDGIQVLLDSQGLLALGSELPHYTASKIFPIILARRPIFAIFHRDSTAASILSETGATQPLVFSSPQALAQMTDRVRIALEAMLRLPSAWEAPTRWEAFEPYTARAGAARLAAVFDRVVGASHKPAAESRP